MKNKELLRLVYKFENLGTKKSSDGATLIGKAPHIGPLGWLNIIYPPLSLPEIAVLENDLSNNLPDAYKDFLLNNYNGLDILFSTFCLLGFRKQINRSTEANVAQPYSIITPNLDERPDHAKESYVFIGGYNWDGSHLYIDKETNLVHCCERWDATSKKQWNSLEEMIISEIERLYSLFDDNGVELDESVPTIPY